MNRFTNLYQVSKTLRFELIPQERTRQLLERTNLIAQDEHRAESYKVAKKIIDRYHKHFIEDVLGSLRVKYSSDGHLDSLEEFQDLYVKQQKTEGEKRSLDKVKEKLRKSIADALTHDMRYKRIDKKELIREDIMSVITPDERTIIEEFRDFTTYFTGFHENRKNMYSHEAKSTAIAYRLIHENLPRFIDNLVVFEKIAASPVSEKFPAITQALSECLNVERIKDMFQLDYYSCLLTQSQIEVYNAVIGGMTLDNGSKIQGLNEYINLYNQQQSQRNDRLPKLKSLYKQILSDREAVSWLPEEFDSDKSLLNAVKDYYISLSGTVLKPLKGMLQDIMAYNLEGIYIPNDQSLNDISQQLFGDWSLITRAITENVKSNCPQKRTENAEKYEKRISDLIKREDSFSIGYLNSCLPNGANICSHFTSLGAVNTSEKQTINLFDQIANAYTEVTALLNRDYPESKNLAQDKTNVAKIKALLDAFKRLQRFIKPLAMTDNAPGKDERFYGEMAVLWEELDHITPLYNKVRNRMTRKPYSTEKFKLTFNIKGNFLSGWVDSKTEKSDNGTQYGGYLFRRLNAIGEYDYYLGVSSNKKLFRQKAGITGIFERLDYYQPKSETIYGNIYNGQNKYEEDKHKLIEAIMSFAERSCDEQLIQHLQTKETPSAMIATIQQYPKLLDELLNDNKFAAINQIVINNLTKTILSLKKIQVSARLEEKHYSLFTELQEIIDSICKEKYFGYYPVDDQEMEAAMNNESKPLLLFKISNKDLSFSESYSKGLRKSRGRDNLHTMLFKALMSGQQSTIDIGTGEVFFRRKSIEAKAPTHPANQEVANKTNDKHSVFPYDLIKDKRYTTDKFSFHLSIFYNYQKGDKNININHTTNAYIHEHLDDMYFIGIDRGERHLLYVCVIDSKGNIVKQFSLNEILNEYKGNVYRTNYHDLLGKREKERQQERESWNTINSIKELKQGYLSQVIHKIVTLMVEYHAMVVLEELNPGFKRGRQKVESSVYQQFEKALIDKLNLLVDKSIAPDQAGGLLNAYQLTNRFTSFREMSRQNGFLFYIPAWNTSKLDPVTGFVDLLHPRYESVDKAKVFFSKFKSIRYNDSKGWYEFAFDYNDFTYKAEGTRTNWTLCTHGTRVETFRNPDANNNWDNREIDLTSEFDKLFNQYGIERNGNLKNSIVQISDKAFFERLTHLLKLVLQMRNSVTGSEIDYLISPVADDNGMFYDSRTCGDFLPENADANGAYNIARKGLWMAMQIAQTASDEKVNLSLSNKEWLTFAQTKPYLD